MNDRAIQRLLDARDACETILRFTKDKTFTSYDGDLQLQLATERLLAIVGEACNQAVKEHPELASQIPDLQGIIGMRSRIIHGYELVDDEVVWETVQSNIPDLFETLTRLIDGQPDP